MDIEGLNKSQIVLLTLLVSFVTSIATGIVTVSLLAQAPPAVTQTINRVVERTVERVVPAETQNAGAGTTKTTVVVKESDLITESIDTNAQSLARILRRGAGPNGEDMIVGLGIIISRGGLIATDSSLITPEYDYAITTAAGTFTATILDRGEGKQTALLRVAADEVEDHTFTPVTFTSDASVLKLGQTIISLSGGERTNVALGIISGLDTTNPTEEEGSPVLTRIKTDIGEGRLLPGSPLVDLFGEVVGLHTQGAQGSDSLANFTPASVLESQTAQFVEQAQ
jgi:S1-C subfamily serine protease